MMRVKELDIVPPMPKEDKEVLKKAKMDFIAFGAISFSYKETNPILKIA